jgi:hypothetical protein
MCCSSSSSEVGAVLVDGVWDVWDEDEGNAESESESESDSESNERERAVGIVGLAIADAGPRVVFTPRSLLYA